MSLECMGNIEAKLKAADHRSAALLLPGAGDAPTR